MEKDSVRDSLQQIIDSKDREINDILGTMNEIQEGFRLTWRLFLQGCYTWAKARNRLIKFRDMDILLLKLSLKFL